MVSLDLLWDFVLFGLGFLLFVKVAELLPKLSGLESYRAACKEKPLVGEKPCTRKQKLDYHQGGVSLVWFIFFEFLWDVALVGIGFFGYIGFAVYCGFWTSCRTLSRAYS